MKIGESIAYIRTKQGLTQAELASKADIAVTALSMIETGYRNPSKKILDKISSVFGIAPEVISFLSLDINTIPDSKKDEFKRLHENFKDLVWELV